MNETTMTVLYLLGAVAFIAVGLLALFLSPEKYAKVFGHLWRVDQNGYPRKNRLDLQRRLVGLVIALMGGLFAKAVIPVFHQLPSTTPPSQSTLLRISGTPWLALGLGVIICAGGLYILIKPELILQWSVKELFSERQVPFNTLRKWRLALRGMGAMMVYASVDLFRAWLKAGFH